MPRLRRVLLIIVEVRADNSAKPDAVALLKLNQKTKTRKAERAAKQQKRIAPQSGALPLGQQDLVMSRLGPTSIEFPLET